MKCYMLCNGCGIHEWDGELIDLRIADDDGDDGEDTELTFHSRACLLEWLYRQQESERTFACGLCGEPDLDDAQHGIGICVGG